MSQRRAARGNATDNQSPPPADFFFSAAAAGVHSTPVITRAGPDGRPPDSHLCKILHKLEKESPRTRRCVQGRTRKDVWLSLHLLGGSKGLPQLGNLGSRLFRLRFPLGHGP